MTSAVPPIRRIICVDGTWCTMDGPNGRGYRNTTNVYRIYVSIKEGIVEGPNTGQLYEHSKHYEQRIGLADDIGSIERLKADAFGKGAPKLIRDPYQQCCKLSALHC